MHRAVLFRSLGATFLLLGSVVFAQGADSRKEDRQQLLAILAEIERGINEVNIDLMAKHFDEKATVTWLNAEVSHGPEGVRSYFKRMVGNGPDAVLSKYVTHPQISQSTQFYADVAVANGTTEDEFTPHHRGPFNFHTVWTATLIKREGKWKIISLTLSTNTFNNVLIDELKQYAVYAGMGGALLGMLLVTAWCYLRRQT